MTVIRAPRISKMHEPPEKISQQQCRRVTDKYAFRLYPILAAVCIILYIVNRLEVFENLQRANERWKKKTYSNSPSEAISNVASLMNATLRAMQDENLYKNSSIAIISGSLKVLSWIGAMYFIFIRITMATMLNIARKTLNMEYVHHYTIINGSRAVMSLFCLVVLHSQWNHPSETSRSCVLFWGLVEFFNLYMNLAGCVASCRVEIRIPTFKDILRFYFLRRNLILFQLLNLTAMLSFVAGVAVLVKVYCDSSIVSYQFALVASLFVIAIMHTCAKMAIMLASASHNWDEDEKGVSWKLLASSFWTIVRYHLGSIVFYSPALECMSYVEGSNKFPDITKEELYAPNDPIFTMECSEMLMAVHGQFFRESKNTLRHSKMKRWINHHSKSITSMVWSDIMVYSSSFFTALIALTSSISTVEDLLSLVMYITIYILINGIYYYIIIKPVNVIEMTIEFSKIVTKEDLIIMELELSTITNESEDMPTQDL